MTRESFEKAIAEGTVEAQITAARVTPGECYYLPSGTVHALGAGILAAEVQTPSDTTFRVFDFNRKDPATGKLRGLHVEQAMQCIDFPDATLRAAPPRRHTAGEFPTAAHLVESEYFTIASFRTGAAPLEKPLSTNEPVIWMMIEGGGEWKVDNLAGPVKFTRGDTLLLPPFLENPVGEDAAGQRLAVYHVSDCE